MTYRSRKHELAYKRHQRLGGDSGCIFCQIGPGHPQWVSEATYFRIVQNRFPYSVWDGQLVEDHLLVTPKRHTDTLEGMSDAEKLEYVSLIARYEGQGYNVFARAPHSAVKSVIHQHTHLIKTTGPTHRFLFFSNRPYIRIVH